MAVRYIPLHSAAAAFAGGCIDSLVAAVAALVVVVAAALAAIAAGLAVGCYFLVV